MTTKKTTKRTSEKKQTPKPELPRFDPFNHHYPLTDDDKRAVANLFAWKVAKDDDEVIGILLMTLGYLVYEKDMREKEELYYLIKSKLMLYTRDYSDALAKLIYRTFRQVKIKGER